jgi:hypothetical protein
MIHKFADSLRVGSGRNWSVQWKTPDDRQRNCPEHVEFYSKNKFEKLVHLVGFIIRIYHDAWSSERQSCKKLKKLTKILRCSSGRPGKPLELMDRTLIVDGSDKIPNLNFPNIRPEIQCHINFLRREKEHPGKLI